MIHSVPCPTCQKTVAWTADSAYRPFCSKRCRLIDLGEWFNEEHRIPGEDADAMAPDPDRQEPI